ncbi:MAG: hypothetical protein LC772_07300 [Chloroflexi bacterium]|nr:hypothetical protein [Chloroflexota bacterium]
MRLSLLSTVSAAGILAALCFSGCTDSGSPGVPGQGGGGGGGTPPPAATRAAESVAAIRATRIESLLLTVLTSVARQPVLLGRQQPSLQGPVLGHVYYSNQRSGSNGNVSFFLDQAGTQPDGTISYTLGLAPPGISFTVTSVEGVTGSGTAAVSDLGAALANLTGLTDTLVSTLGDQITARLSGSGGSLSGPITVTVPNASGLTITVNASLSPDGGATGSVSAPGTNGTVSSNSDGSGTESQSGQNGPVTTTVNPNGSASTTGAGINESTTNIDTQNPTPVTGGGTTTGGTTAGGTTTGGTTTGGTTTGGTTTGGTTTGGTTTGGTTGGTSNPYADTFINADVLSFSGTGPQGGSRFRLVTDARGIPTVFVYNANGDIKNTGDPLGSGNFVQPFTSTTPVNPATGAFSVSTSDAGFGSGGRITGNITRTNGGVETSNVQVYYDGQLVGTGSPAGGSYGSYIFAGNRFSIAATSGFYSGNVSSDGTNTIGTFTANVGCDGTGPASITFNSNTPYQASYNNTSKTVDNGGVTGYDPANGAFSLKFTGYDASTGQQLTLIGYIGVTAISGTTFYSQGSLTPNEASFAGLLVSVTSHTPNQQSCPTP